MNDDGTMEGVDADNRTQASVLASVVLLTEKMLCSARDDEWEAVTEYELERREALALCFATPIPVEQSELFSEALAAMLHMNEEMIGLLEVAKENVAIKRSDQRHVKRSVSHYLDVEKNH